MLAFANRVRFLTATTGTGTLAVSGSVGGYQTPDQAGVPSGSTVGYSIEDGANFEVGQGIYTTGATPSLTRALIESSSNGGAAITLTGNAVVFFDMTAAIVASLVQPSPYGSNPAMDGTAAPGSSALYARGDHVHPTDTSRAPTANPSFTGTITNGGTISGGALSGTITNGGTISGGTLAGTIHTDGATISGGWHYGSVTASTTVDLSKHVDIFGGTFGLNVTSARLNIVTPVGASAYFVAGDGTDILQISTTQIQARTGLNFGSVLATGVDLSKHLTLFGSDYGLNVTTNHINIVTAGTAVATLGTSGISAAVPVTVAADPTAALGVATKQYVDSRVGVSSFNTRTGGITLSSADVTAALGYTPLDAAGGSISGSLTVGGALTGGSLNTGGTVTASVGSISGTLTAGALTTGGAINGGTVHASGGVSGASASFSGACNAGSGAFSGSCNALTLQSTGSFSAGATGWAYTATGPGSSTGTFTFGVSAGSAAMAAAFYMAVSDRRLKQDITPITGDDGVAWVQKSRPITYTKLGSPGAGFVSQEQIASGYGQYVATLPHEGLPEETDDNGVTSSPDVALHLDYNNYVAFLTAALQSVLQRLSVVEGELSRLTARY